MPLEKQGNFTFNHSDQPDDLYNVKTDVEIKQAFDSRASELKDTINAIVDSLQSIVDGDSGADNIKATAIEGLTGSTVQALLEALKGNDDTNKEYLLSQIHDIVLGQIPDGSITDVKLSDAEGQIKQTVSEHQADDVRHITSFERDNWNGIALNSYASSVDANGIYTVVDYKRADGTLYLKSTLSGGTSPNYTTDTWQYYDADGTTLLSTKTWTITYDANGKVTSKAVA